MSTPAPLESHPATHLDAGPAAGQPLPLTTRSAAAATLYRDALDRIHGAEAGAQSLLDEALCGDPQFAVAHAARYMLAHGDGDAQVAAAARDAAMAGLGAISAWERGHVECLVALVQRDPDAWGMARAHLDAHPGDLLVASQLIGDLFFHGGTGKRQAAVDVLRAIEAHNRDDWAFAARLGFHLSELGDFAGAIPLLRSALSARPQAPFVAHAMAHALLESGERAASHAMLSEWVAAHDPTGPIDGHIHWHLALGELEAGSPERAVARFVRHCAPGKSHCAMGLTLADAGGLFGRMALDGHDLDTLEAVPRPQLLQMLASLQGALKLPFVAVHAAALALSLGEDEALERCVQAMQARAGSGGGDAGQRAVAAFAHYVAGDMAACVQSLQRDRGGAFESIGGSNEERALLAKLQDRARTAGGRPGTAAR